MKNYEELVDTKNTLQNKFDLCEYIYDKRKEERKLERGR